MAHLIKFHTEHKIATIKAIREASINVFGRAYTLKYAKDMVEQGAIVPDHQTDLMLRLIAGATQYIAVGWNTNCGVGDRPSFSFTCQLWNPPQAPVDFSKPLLNE